MQSGDVAAFEALLRQLLQLDSSSTAGAGASSAEAIPGTLLEAPALTAAAQGPAPAAVPAAAAAGFCPNLGAAAPAIPALGATGADSKVWLLGRAPMGPDVDLVLLLHEQLGALLLNTQVSWACDQPVSCSSPWCFEAGAANMMDVCAAVVLHHCPSWGFTGLHWASRGCAV